MTLNKSQIAKALSIAIVGSSVALMGCEKAETPNNSTTVAAPQQQTNLARTASESLEAVYAEMRAKQVSNVSYKLSVTIDNKSESFSGSTELMFDLAKNNQNDLTIDFDEGTVKSLTVNGKTVNFSYEK